MIIIIIIIIIVIVIKEKDRCHIFMIFAYKNKSKRKRMLVGFEPVTSHLKLVEHSQVTKWANSHIQKKMQQKSI
jgi:hypothetical protein